ncbi:MAG TPA: arginine--tRNA ligase [Myxococcota bacterium]|nr:arginine--tRNA ligase [Myxococcota bacterium]
MIKEAIRQQVKKAHFLLVSQGKLSSASGELLDTMAISRPKEKSHGDFSVNIAMILAKPENMSPRNIASLFEESLTKNEGYFAHIEIAGPGFINLTLSTKALALIIPYIVSRGAAYGRIQAKQTRTALVEFVSANPTGGLHLGHARGAFVGDAIARLLSAAGFAVTKEYYVNDIGNQVEILARTIHKRYRELFGEQVTIESGEYPGEYVKDIAIALKNFYGDLWLDKPEEEWLFTIGRFGVDYNLALIKRSLDAAGIAIDHWYSEQTLYEQGKLDALIMAYDQRHLLYEADMAKGSDAKVRREESKAHKYAHMQAGGTYLRTSKFGDEEDRIIKRRDGRFVYLTADLAYHNEKYARGFDFLVDVFGADHAGHINRIKAGMAALGHDIKKLHFVVVQMVRLIKGGKELKFSKRAGQVIGLDDLIDEVGRDVARFVFLMRSTNAQFDLDIDAVTKQSSDNPVFYVQYGHARMATILARAKDEGLVVEPHNFNEEQQALLVLPEERDLILRISELEDLVEESALALEPHRLIFFCHELIKTFHSYFTKYRHSEKMISDDLAKTKARLAMVVAIKNTIFNALSILGISAPDYMELSASTDDG